MSKAFPTKEKYVLYEDRGDYHLLLLNFPPDNRFTVESIPAIIECVDYIKTLEKKPLVTSSTNPKFYSNGLDFERAVKTPKFFSKYYLPVMLAILEFPAPTIALVNGHCFAGAFIFAMCHDHVIMNPERGFLCMNEVLFGAPLAGPMLSVFRVKLGTRLTEKIVLTGQRFTSTQALEQGIISAKGGYPEVEKLVKSIKVLTKSPSYGMIRCELLRDVIAELRDKAEESDGLFKKINMSQIKL